MVRCNASAGRSTRTAPAPSESVASGNETSTVQDEVSESVPSAEDEEPQTPLAQATALLAKAVANPLFYLVTGLGAVKFVAGSSAENEYGIFALAALPIVALTIISKTEVGMQVQQALESKIPELLVSRGANPVATCAVSCGNLWMATTRIKRCCVRRVTRKRTFTN